MTPAKLDVLVAFLSYGGNGSVGMQLPEITTWFAKNFVEMKADERIGRIAAKRFGDVPLSMERNRIVKTAKQEGFDVILMLDSDNVPDLYLGHRKWAQPFWKTSFDLLYERHVKGLPTVVCAPYCGPPPHPVTGGEENVYVFYSENMESGAQDQHFRFAAYSRTHAAQMRGIQEIACGPTGVVLYSTSAFDLMPVGKMSHAEILEAYKSGKITQTRALQLLAMDSWFFYEYTDKERTQKASTEDVTNTREIALAGFAKHHQPTVFCNWDAWAGHMKPKCVGMPEPIFMEQINEIYQEAVTNNLQVADERREVDFTGGDPIADFHPDGAESLSGVWMDEEVPLPPKEQIEKGAPLISRMLFGRKVVSVAHVTPPDHLESLNLAVEVLAQSFKDRPLRVVEVGSWVGESAIALQAGFGPRGGTVFCIDNFRGNANDYLGDVAKALTPEFIKDWFVKNTGELLGSRIKLIEGKSLEVAEELDPQEADLVFLDAEHDYDSVVFDIEAWAPHVADHGYLMGHDYHDEFPGLKQAVDEFMQAAGLDTQLISGTSLWMCPMGAYRKAMRELEASRAKEEPVGA